MVAALNILMEQFISVADIKNNNITMSTTISIVVSVLVGLLTSVVGNFLYELLKG